MIQLKAILLILAVCITGTVLLIAFFALYIDACEPYDEQNYHTLNQIEDEQPN